MRTANMFVQFQWLIQFVQLRKGKISKTAEQILQQKERRFGAAHSQESQPNRVTGGLKFKNLCVKPDQLKLYLWCLDQF